MCGTMAIVSRHSHNGVTPVLRKRQRKGCGQRFVKCATMHAQERDIGMTTVLLEVYGISTVY